MEGTIAWTAAARVNYRRAHEHRQSANDVSDATRTPPSALSMSTLRPAASVSSRGTSLKWKSRFKSCRRKLDAAVEETKKLRREVKAGAPGLHREVTRLRKELSQALAEPSAAATQARKHRLAAQLLRGHDAWPAALAATRSGRLHALEHALAHEVALHLRERRPDLRKGGDQT